MVVAVTIMRHPEQTKETVERATLDITAVEIPHSIRFTLLLLLRIQRYMWRNHVATWLKSITVTGIWIEIRLGFRVCVIFCNIIIGFDFNLSLYLEKTQSTVAL